MTLRTVEMPQPGDRIWWKDAAGEIRRGLFIGYNPSGHWRVLEQHSTGTVVADVPVKWPIYRDDGHAAA